MINKPNATREVLDNFGTIDGKKAEAWSAQDREMIFEAVEESIGFNELNIIVKEQLRSWVRKQRGVRGGTRWPRDSGHPPPATYPTTSAPRTTTATCTHTHTHTHTSHCACGN